MHAATTCARGWHNVDERMVETHGHGTVCGCCDLDSRSQQRLSGKGWEGAPNKSSRGAATLRMFLLQQSYVLHSTSSVVNPQSNTQSPEHGASSRSENTGYVKHENEAVRAYSLDVVHGTSAASFLYCTQQPTGRARGMTT